MADFPTYPATTTSEAAELLIFSSNQMHEIINGSATDTVTTEDGEIPSLRKSLVDNMYFVGPEDWSEGDEETVFNNLRTYNEVWYYAPDATTDNPISMGSSPTDDDNWRVYAVESEAVTDFISLTDVEDDDYSAGYGAVPVITSSEDGLSLLSTDEFPSVVGVADLDGENIYTGSNIFKDKLKFRHADETIWSNATITTDGSTDNALYISGAFISDILSERTNDITWYNATFDSAEGSVVFDGSSTYGELVNSLELTSYMTFNFTFSISSTAVSTHTIVSGAETYASTFVIDIASSRLRIYAYDANGDRSDLLYSTTYFEEDVEYEINVVISGSFVYIYVDGELENSGTIDTTGCEVSFIGQRDSGAYLYGSLYNFEVTVDTGYTGRILTESDLSTGEDGDFEFIPAVESDGAMTVGQSIDFHDDVANLAEFSTRLQTNGATDGELFVVSNIDTEVLDIAIDDSTSDEQTNSVDSDNPLTLYNVTWSDSSATFDGSTSYGLLGEEVLLTKDFTISVDVTTSESSAIGVIWSNSDESMKVYMNASGTVVLLYKDLDSTVHYMTTTTTANDGSSHTILVQYSASEASFYLYLDGELEVTNTAAYCVKKGVYSVGYQSVSENRYFNGVIANLYIEEAGGSPGKVVTTDDMDYVYIENAGLMGYTAYDGTNAGTVVNNFFDAGHMCIKLRSQTAYQVDTAILLRKNSVIHGMNEAWDQSGFVVDDAFEGNIIDTQYYDTLVENDVRDSDPDDGSVACPTGVSLKDFYVKGNLHTYPTAISSLTAGEGIGIRLFGKQFVIDNVRITECANVGLITRYGDSGDFDDSSDYTKNPKAGAIQNTYIYDTGHEGMIFYGPTDIWLNNLYIGVTNSTNISSDYDADFTSIEEPDIGGNFGFLIRRSVELGWIHSFGNVQGFCTGMIGDDDLFITARVRFQYLMCESGNGGIWVGERVRLSGTLLECHTNVFSYGENAHVDFSDTENSINIDNIDIYRSASEDGCTGVVLGSGGSLKAKIKFDYGATWDYLGHGVEIDGYGHDLDIVGLAGGTGNAYDGTESTGIQIYNTCENLRIKADIRAYDVGVKIYGDLYRCKFDWNIRNSNTTGVSYYNGLSQATLDASNIIVYNTGSSGETKTITDRGTVEFDATTTEEDTAWFEYSTHNQPAMEDIQLTPINSGTDMPVISNYYVDSIGAQYIVVKSTCDGSGTDTYGMSIRIN